MQPAGGGPDPERQHDGQRDERVGQGQVVHQIQSGDLVDHLGGPAGEAEPADAVEQTAEAIDISAATVKREWTLARAWLRRELGKSF